MGELSQKIKAAYQMYLELTKILSKKRLEELNEEEMDRVFQILDFFYKEWNVLTSKEMQELIERFSKMKKDERILQVYLKAMEELNNLLFEKKLFFKVKELNKLRQTLKDNKEKGIALKMLKKIINNWGLVLLSTLVMFLSFSPQKFNLNVQELDRVVVNVSKMNDDNKLSSLVRVLSGILPQVAYASDWGYEKNQIEEKEKIDFIKKELKEKLSEEGIRVSDEIINKLAKYLYYIFNAKPKKGAPRLLAKIQVKEVVRTYLIIIHKTIIEYLNIPTGSPQSIQILKKIQKITGEIAEKYYEKFPEDREFEEKIDRLMVIESLIRNY